IKYKNKIKQLLIHALGLKTINDIINNRSGSRTKFNKLIGKYYNRYDLDVMYFVFDKDYDDYQSDYICEYLDIRDDFKNNTIKLDKPVNLPKEVLEGFNNFYKRNIDLNTLISMGNTSTRQKIQLQNTVKRHSNNKMELKIDFNKYSILDLLKYMYNKKEITISEIYECTKIIKGKALKIRKEIKNEFVLDLEDTAIILDCSDSNYGSEKTKLHPLFKNIMLMNIFGIAKNVIKVGGKFSEKGLIIPAGNTNLSYGLLKAAKDGYKNAIVLSDGFENVGDFDKVYKQLKHIGVDINVIHFNPVFSPKNFSFKSISDEVITFPYSNENDIKNIMMFYLLNTDTEKFKEKMRERIDTMINSKI
ncbi:MAG: hypothetical protein ACOCRK_03670, partial [bacterium]